MRGIIYRIKNGIFRKKTFIVNVGIYSFLFSILFLLIYIDKVSNKLENDIFSNFNIHGTIIFDSKKEESIQEYIDNIEEFKQMIFDLSKNGNSSYYDFSYVSNKLNPIYPIKITSKNISIVYKNVGLVNENSYNNDKACMDSSNSCIIMFPYLTSTFSEIPSDFHFDATSLLKGRFFTKEEIENGAQVCLMQEGSVLYDGITKQYLDIGDFITISEIIKDEDGKTLYYKEYEFEIIGLYTINNSDYITHNGITGSSIYLPYKQFDNMWYSAIEHIMEYNPNYYSTLFNMKFVALNPAYFKFDNIESLHTFIKVLEKYESKFLEKEYRYSSTIDDQFSTISNILSVSTSFTYISGTILIMCIGITIFILLFELNNRKDEIGLLLSLGESYKRITIQFVIELFISLFASIFISLSMVKVFGALILKYIINSEFYVENIKILNSILQMNYDTKIILSYISYTILIVAMNIVFIALFVKRVEINDLLRSK